MFQLFAVLFYYCGISLDCLVDGGWAGGITTSPFHQHCHTVFSSFHSMIGNRTKTGEEEGVWSLNEKKNYVCVCGKKSSACNGVKSVGEIEKKKNDDDKKERVVDEKDDGLVRELRWRW